MTAADLTGEELIELLGANSIAQFSVEAGEGDEFFIDDVYFI